MIGTIAFGIFGLAVLVGIAFAFLQSEARSTGNWSPPASACNCCSPLS